MTMEQSGPCSSATGGPSNSAEFEQPNTFGNFHTPENGFFYSKRPYQALDPSIKEIRLLRVNSRRTYAEHLQDHPEWISTDTDADEMLHPGGGLDGLQSDAQIFACQLVDKVALSRIEGGYCALSYCAGKPTNTAWVLVNGTPFKAFANLEHAIGLAVDAWKAQHPGKDFLLWTDQICINQNDHFEKATQVAMMHEIYSGSSNTFICLSTPGAENCLSWMPLSYFNWSPSGKSLDYRVMERFLWDLLSLPSSQRKQRFHGWCSSFKAFIDSPWWGRAWVYQEFMSSSRPLLLSGADCVLLKSGSPAWDIIQRVFVRYDFRGAVDSVGTQLLHSKPEQDTSVDAAGAQTDSEEMRELLGLMEERTHIVYFSAVKSAILNKAISPSSQGLLPHLRHSRNCASSDPRDRVYAFLSLAGDYDIVPDYSPGNTIGHVLVQTAKAIIQRDKRLDILADAGLGAEKSDCHLPSWVPDWTSPETFNGNKQLHTFFSHTTLHSSTTPQDADASKGSACQPTFRANEARRTNLDLGIKGVYVDTLRDPLAGKDMSARNGGDLQMFALPSGRLVVSPATALSGDEIWVLLGARSPVALRRQESDLYCLVGNVVVCNGMSTQPSAVMLGEAIEWVESGTAELREIWLL
ncbi:heterokaryon incompatibility protein-domain-containing protein [Lasiosphaeria ovina]|uniref:Heterokaryon incompatibility protein-domain-containing protein n=1 Tax=Lasiosphaeria ovina TaxID=92902 RepID=A0AAE0KDY5_9PEZI|nr:heterokaryon incompatibility protein-domain-containing protein [Lasiosphaeria ovina]